MDAVVEYLPFLIPVVIIQLALALTAVVHILKHKKFKFGNTVLWVLVALFIQLIGPILYFTIGKADE